ncbi:hypothetical protein V1264_024101 [Littorina saxatilis]|uniref:Fibronectin type-III domain-containing protein n=1 Tax=Littorina saxatilis TaxID=31220 RepID=A0AAN9B8K8_9CAEN
MFGVRGQHFSVCGHLSSYLLLTVVLCQALHVGGLWFEPKGRIEKNASYNSMYYVGENLKVHCIKFSDFTGEVYFQQGNRNYSQEYVTQINTTHALLDKPVTDDDFEETTLSCADGDGLVANDTIYTDYAPQNATDLKMVWLNEVNLFINWGFNNTPYKIAHSESLINVTGEWCSNPSSASCEIPGITNEWATVYVRVNMTNVRRTDTVSTEFPGVKIRHHVKPLPVSSVHVTALNSTSVRVDVTTVLYKSFYTITYHAPLGDEGNYNTTSKTSEKSFVISGLHPAYSYTFDVRCKYEAHRGYLSEPVQFNLGRMPEDVPSTAPVVTPGGFYLDCSPGSDKSANNATAFIYYQVIPEEDKNGEIVNYTATVHGDEKNLTFTQSGTTRDPRTVKLDSVPCGGNFDVTLHAHTAVGPSPGAVLHVPRWSEEPDSIVDKLKLKLRLNNGAITAEWEPVADTHNMSLLVYYCNKASDNAMCQSAILHVNITAANGSYPLPSADANMKFGVAAILQDDATTGIKFTECIYDPTKVSPIPSDVRASGQTDSILVMWKGENACDSTKRIIIYNYEIELVVPGGSETIRYVVDASKGVYELRNVTQDTDYQVRMRAITSSGVSGFSDPVRARLSSIVSGLKDEEIAGIAMAVLVVVFILGSLVFCFCRDKFRAVKSKFSRSVDIPTPTLSREFHHAGQPGSSFLTGVSNQGFVPVGTSAAVTHKHQDSKDSGYIDNSPATPRQVVLQGADSVPSTGPTDLTITDHTQSASPDGNVGCTAYVTMADGYIQGDDSGCIVSSGEEPAAAVAECKSAHIPVPACFGGGESDEGLDTVGKGTLKDFPSLSDTGSNSYVRFSTEDCPRQDGEQLSGEPAEVVINFSKGKCPAPFEPVVGVVHVALSDPGTTPTAVNSGNGVDSEAKLDPKKEDNGWAAPAETVTNPTQDFTLEGATNSVDREVTVSVPEQQGLGSYSQISSSGVTEKSRRQGTQEGEPSDERLEASPATVSPGYVTHDVTHVHAQSGPTRHVNQQDASDNLQGEAAPGSMEDPSPSHHTYLPSSAPGGRLDEPCNPANVNPEPENPIQQDLSPTTRHLPSVLSTPSAADSPPRPPQQPVEQGEGAVLDPQIDRDIDPAPQGRVIDPAPQGHLDQEPATDIPLLSAMPGGYVLRHATIPDVSLPVQDEDDSEGGSQHTEKDEDDSEGRSQHTEKDEDDSEGRSQHTEKDAARSEESGSSLSDSTPSQSSNGAGYVPLDKVEKMTLILDSSAAMVTADESDAGGREGGGGRGGFERLDSGYSSPNSAQRSPQWRSSPGFTSVQETPHNDNDDETFNMTPGEPARAAPKKGVAKQRHGERIKGENAGKERGSLGGALVMSSPMRQASSGYVERNDVFAAPSETSA